MLYCIWDTKKDKRAGINSYFTKRQAVMQIEAAKARRVRGGRPDIDPSGYVPRQETAATRKW